MYKIGGINHVLRIPAALCKVLGIKPGDSIRLTIKDSEIIVTNCTDKVSRLRKIDKNTYIVPVRWIGAERKYLQLGFTVPSRIAEKFHDRRFSIELREKIGDSFKIVYKPKDQAP